MSVVSDLNAKVMVKLTANAKNKKFSFSIIFCASNELTVDEMSLGQMPFDGVAWCP